MCTVRSKMVWQRPAVLIFLIIHMALLTSCTAVDYCPPVRDLTVTDLKHSFATFRWKPPPSSQHTCLLVLRGSSVNERCDTGTWKCDCYLYSTSQGYILEPYTEYVVCAQAKCNEVYSPSSCRTLKTPPAAPLNPYEVFVDATSSTSLTVSWRLPTKYRGPLDGYRIRWCEHNNCDMKEVHVTRDHNRDYVITNLKPYVVYSVSVSAYNTWEGQNLYSDDSYVRRTTAAANPGPPVMTYWKRSSTSVSLRITPPKTRNGPIDGYKLETCITLRCYDPYSAVWTYSESDPGVRTVTNLLPWHQYTFTLKAYNTVNNIKLYSPEVSLTVGTMMNSMSQPSKLLSKVINSNSVELTWTSPLSAEKNPEWYRITWCTVNEEHCFFTKIQNERGIVIKLLKPGTTYNFTVLGIASFDSYWAFGDASTVAATTSPGVPSRPTNIRASRRSPTEIYLTWDAPFDPQGPVDGYKTRVCKGTCTDEGAFIPREQREWNVTGLVPYTKYHFLLRAFNVHPEEGIIDGDLAMLNVFTEPTVPGEPTNLNIQDINDTSILVTWGHPINPNGPLSSYKVSWRKAQEHGKNWSPVPYSTALTRNNTFTITGLERNTTYDVTVLRINEGGEEKVVGPVVRGRNLMTQ